jgi:hypothetical protein
LIDDGYQILTPGVDPKDALMEDEQALRAMYAKQAAFCAACCV